MLQRELLSGLYRHGAYRHFVVREAKKRHIQAAPFRDRVVHHAVYDALTPIFERSFIYDSYACRTGKGAIAAIERFERFAEAHMYALTCDVSKYFASVDHRVLQRLLAKKVNDAQMLQLCTVIIESNEGETDTPGKGIPIGNVTSQLFANVYLNELDQFVKHSLRFRRYVRYMDDFILLSADKAELHEARQKIEAFLSKELLLTLHPKKVQVIPVRSGVEYLGYRIFPQYRKLKRATVSRFIARTRRARSCGGGALLGARSVVAGIRNARPLAQLTAFNRKAGEDIHVRLLTA